MCELALVRRRLYDCGGLKPGHRGLTGAAPAGREGALGEGAGRTAGAAPHAGRGRTRAALRAPPATGRETDRAHFRAEENPWTSREI